MQEAEFHADADLWLSPEMRLLADVPGIEDFVYDGHGNRIVLPEGMDAADPLPLILVGAGKTLLLRNVKLVYASSLPACLQLGAGKPLACYSWIIAILCYWLLSTHPVPTYLGP